MKTMSRAQPPRALGRLRIQRLAVIGDELLDTFRSELVIGVKAAPGLFQIERLVGNRRTAPRVGETLIGHLEAALRPLAKDFGRHGHEIGADREAVQEVRNGTDARSQHEYVTIAALVHAR